MARADLIISLIKNSFTGNRYQFKKVVEAIIAEERSKQHIQLADKLQAELEQQLKSVQHDVYAQNITAAATSPVVNNFLQEVSVKKTFEDLVFPTELMCTTNEFVEEQLRADILRSYGIEPRHKILLVGAPGTGKTSYAEALAERLMLPLYIVRYDALIGSYLGETASRLRQLFDFVSSRRCILFFDEYDTIGKERGDSQEMGEIKRVVSSLLLMTDSLPSYTIVIGASNHPELLDKAAWRRFQLRVEIPMPSESLIAKWIDLFSHKHNIDFCMPSVALAKKLKGRSFSDIENFALTVARRYYLTLPSVDMKAIVNTQLKELNRNLVKTPQLS